MNPIDALKAPLAILLVCGATLAHAEFAESRLVPVVERRGEPVAAPLEAQARGGAMRTLTPDAPARDAGAPDWMMVLAGLAIAGWIANRRLGAPLE